MWLPKNVAAQKCDRPKQKNMKSRNTDNGLFNLNTLTLIYLTLAQLEKNAKPHFGEL